MAYPTSVTTFSTLQDGIDYPQVAHINPLGTEINAIEAALLSTGLAHDLKFVDATYDIGKSGATRPRDLFLSRNATIGGTLAVTGVATFTAQSVHNAGLDISGASAGQIVFPAAQNASSGANTLDDYEEGTWTPVIGGEGGTSGQSYTAQDGRYVKIGQFVIAQFRVVLSAEGTITGSAQIQGLPFAASSLDRGTFAALRFAGLATNWITVGVAINASGTTGNLQGLTAAASANTTELTAADIGNTTDLRGTIVYRAGA